MSTSRRAFIGVCGVACAAPAWAALADDAEPFAPPIGLCASPSAAAEAARAGAAYLEVTCGALDPRASDDLIERRLAALRMLPLPVRGANGFLPGSIRVTGPDADPAAALAWSETVFRRARSVGIETICFGSSAARSIPDDFPRDVAELQFAALLGRMGDLAARHEVLVVVEPLNARETNFINTVADGTRIVGAVDHPNVALTADIYHMLCAGEGSEAIRAAGPLVRHVHVAELKDRAAPGVSGVDFTPYLRALRDIDYRGRISIECRWTDRDAQLPGAVAAVRRQLESLS